jgi:hypothetical protein
MGRLSRFSISCPGGDRVGAQSRCFIRAHRLQRQAMQLAGYAQMRPMRVLLLQPLRGAHLQQLRLVIPYRLPPLLVGFRVLGIWLQPGLVALDCAVPHLRRQEGGERCEQCVWTGLELQVQTRLQSSSRYHRSVRVCAPPAGRGCPLTFSGTVDTREMASPIVSARPTRPTLRHTKAGRRAGTAGGGSSKLAAGTMSVCRFFPLLRVCLRQRAGTDSRREPIMIPSDSQGSHAAHRWM